MSSSSNASNSPKDEAPINMMSTEEEEEQEAPINTNSPPNTAAAAALAMVPIKHFFVSSHGVGLHDERHHGRRGDHVGVGEVSSCG